MTTLTCAKPVGRRIWLSVPVLALLAFMLVAQPVNAWDRRIGDTVIIKPGEVVNDDLYVSANEFQLEGTVKGDLIVFARTIRIGGMVEGDLAAAGQEVIISGEVRDDVRLAAAVVTLQPSAKINDDFFGVGASIETKTGSVVNGGLVAAGSQALLAGQVAQDAWFTGNRLRLQGKVGGNLHANMGNGSDGALPTEVWRVLPGLPAFVAVPPGLTIDPHSSIGGKLDYVAPAEIAVPAGVAREVQFTPQSQAQTNAGAQATAATTPTDSVIAWLLDQLRSYIGLLVVGLLLIWLLPGTMRRATEALTAKPWQVLGWGLVIVIVFPIVSILLLIVAIAVAIALGALTLSGLSTTLIVSSVAALISALVFFGLVVGYFTKIVVGYWVGQWFLNRVLCAAHTHPIWAMVIGLVPVALLVGIPYLGPIISIIIALLGLGVIWIMLQTRQPTTTAAVPTRPTLSTQQPT